MDAAAEHPAKATLSLDLIQAKPSFPILDLPRELRDEIYGYLLDSRRVKYTPTPSNTATHSQQYAALGGRAHTYDFQTAILVANKEIGREAADYLHKNNNFILVYFSMAAFHHMLHLSDVPIITDRKLETFNRHAMEVELDWEDSPFVQISVDYHDEWPDIDDGTVLMVLEDFPKLCGMLRYMCQYILPPSVFVTKRGIKVGPDLGPRDAGAADMLAMTVTIGPTKSRSLCESVKPAFLTIWRP